jgi:hypothetical protein
MPSSGICGNRSPSEESDPVRRAPASLCAFCLRDRAANRSGLQSRLGLIGAKSFQPDLGDAVLFHVQYACRRRGKIDDAALDPGPAVVDLDLDRSSIAEVGHPHDRAECQCRMRGRESVLIENFAGSGGLAIQGGTIEGRDAALREERLCHQRAGRRRHGRRRRNRSGRRRCDATGQTSQCKQEKRTKNVAHGTSPVTREQPREFREWVPRYCPPMSLNWPRYRYSLSAE